MNKIRRYLVFYIAIACTFMIILSYSLIKIVTTSTERVASSADKIEKEIEKLSKTQDSTKKIIDEFKKLKAEIAVSKQDQVLGQEQKASTSSGLSLGFVTISDKKWQTVNVYEDKSSASKVVGVAGFEKAYLFETLEDGWYKIKLPNSKLTGWVSSRFFKELTENML